MRIPNALGLLGFCGVLLAASEDADRSVAAGPGYSHYRLTLGFGEGSRFLGPVGISETSWPQRFNRSLAPGEWLPESVRDNPSVVAETARSLTLAPLFSHYTEPAVQATHWDFLYPVVTYDAYASESRLQVFQLLSLSGGDTQSGEQERTYTVFPFYFARRSEDPARNYTAVWPIYGRMANRLFRDETEFALWPLYVKTRKRDVVTRNYVAPFVHVREGDGLRGWQFWPFYGHESKTLTSRTNTVGELEPVPGHEKSFVLWPFYVRGDQGMGTTNAMHQRMMLPFYSVQLSPARDSRTYFWPFGVTLSEDREIGYRQTAVVWPFFIRARGPGKQEDRLWPFYGQTRYEELTSRFFLWPLVAQRRVSRGPLKRDIDQVGLVLFNSTRERNEQTGQTQKRTGLWPLFLWKRDWEGLESFQCLAPLSALMPKNASIARTYAPFFALWRSEKNGQTGASSQSVLWNLYRRERTPEKRKSSFLFGLFQYESGSAGKRVKLFFIPFGRSPGPAQGTGGTDDQAAGQDHVSGRR